MQDKMREKGIKSHQKQVSLYKITEESNTLQTTQTDFATTMNKDSNRFSPRGDRSNGEGEELRRSNAMV